MPNYRLQIAYDGTRYNGFQRLKENEMTIQGKLEHVLSLLAEEEVEVIASGRTDKGVHARGQTANFHCVKELKTNRILEHCRKYLPQDILVYGVKKTDERFHARYLAKTKEYVYQIDNRTYPDVFQREYRWHIEKPLDLAAMEEGKAYLLGEHDFSGFTSLKSKKKSFIRRIDSIEIRKNKGDIDLIFEGNGFLQHMVRIMTGTLVEIGLHQRKPEEVLTALEQKDRTLAGETAPAKGLFLNRVFYD